MDFLNLLVPFGVSLIGSFVTGKVQKSATPLPNKFIPGTNALMFGGATAGVTGNPIDAAAAGVGALTASLIFSGIKKVTGK